MVVLGLEYSEHKWRPLEKRGESSKAIQGQKVTGLHSRHHQHVDREKGNTTTPDSSAKQTSENPRQVFILRIFVSAIFMLA